MRYELPPYYPDQLPRGDVLTRCVNVVPAQGGYRATGGFESISAALPAAFRGGGSFISTTGTAYLLAGTATTLSRLSGGTWTSLLSALTIAGRWKFAQFGDYVVCANGQATQAVNLTAATAAAIAGAPTFIDVCVVGDYVVGAQPNGDKLKVRNSAFNDHTGWTVGTNQCTEQIMLEGGEVMGVTGGEYGIILQRQRLVRMTRTGEATAPFQYDPISENIGCASKASIVAVGKTVFFLSDRGFMALDGGEQPRPIGKEKFDQTFRDGLGEDSFERIHTAVDPKQTRVYWGIPGVVGTIWGYDWALDRPFTIELPFDGIFAGFTNSTDLDALAATYPNLDAMPYTLDDPRWSGGAPRLYVVQSGQVGTLTGANMAAEMETGEFAPSKNRATKLRAVWPETDAIAGITVTVKQSQRRGDGGSTRTGSSLQASGRIPLQASGKFMSFKVAINDPDWTYIDALTLEAGAGGLR